MPDITDIKRISELPVADQANATDLLEASQANGVGYVTKSITLDQIADVVAEILPPPEAGWDDITGKPSTFPPTVPIAYTDISGTPTIPTTLPPNGAAGGALTGTYPNPTLVGGPLSNYATTAFVAAALSGLSIKTTWFSASGTYTPDAKMIFAHVKMRGGGGGSDSRTGSAGWAIGIGGGGQGGYVEKWVMRAAVLPTVAVTIGGGGSAANNGSTTSFGALANATGGSYGTSAYAGSGGSGTGDLVMPGEPGGMGMAIAGTAYAVGGSGGGGQRGAAAPTTTGDLQDGFDGNANTGGGASGCALNNSTGSRTGRTGGSGWLQIIEVLTP